MWVWSLGQEDPLEEGMATHSSILAWRIPMDRAWWAIVHNVTKNQTWLKWLSMQVCVYTYISLYIHILIDIILALFLWEHWLIWILVPDPWRWCCRSHRARRQDMEPKRIIFKPYNLMRFTLLGLNLLGAHHLFLPSDFSLFEWKIYPVLVPSFYFGST